jgi:membrane-bound ClpP family serine protease
MLAVFCGTGVISLCAGEAVIILALQAGREPSSSSRLKMAIFDVTITEVLNERLAALEKHFEADVIFYFGEINPGYIKVFRDFIERLKADPAARDRLVVVLNTPGGSAEMVEKMVEIIRHHYAEVYFVVPDFAMSAGTIFCMSGDKIYMDYSSSLGPIDPQVFNGKDWVPALGYLDKVEELIKKAQAQQISRAEFLILQSQDLATLSRCEQARDLTITLLKKWLVEYKFKDWTVHQTTPEKLHQPVTLEEKRERAEEIARILGSNKKWHSHERMLGIETVRRDLRLQVEDYSADETLKGLVRAYNDLMIEYIARIELPVFMHSRI